MFVQIFAPAVVATLWPTRSGPRRTSAGGGANGGVESAANAASAAVAHYNIAAGMGIVLWVLTLVDLINKGPVALEAFTQMLQNPEATRASAANALLAVDTAALCLGLLVFAAMEDGMAMATRVVAGSVLLGPGAAISLYLANVRERRIGVAVTHSLRKAD